MNGIHRYIHAQLGADLRVMLDKNGEPQFVLEDVCKALGMTVEEALSILGEEEGRDAQ